MVQQRWQLCAWAIVSEESNHLLLPLAPLAVGGLHRGNGVSAVWSGCEAAAEGRARMHEERWYSLWHKCNGRRNYSD